LNDPAFLHLRHPRQKNAMGSLRDYNEFNIWDDSWQRWFNTIRRSVNKSNIIRSVHRDYNHSHTPTDAHNLYKITNHPSTWTLLRVSAINLYSQRDIQQIISLFFFSPLQTHRFCVTRISLSTVMEDSFPTGKRYKLQTQLYALKTNWCNEHKQVNLRQTQTLTLTLLTWRIWWARNTTSRWQMGFNSAFKGLIFF